MKPSVSIIIPVYNAEKYLNRCLNSIVKQKNRDFEVLLIDDGSTDSSGIICEEYAIKDKRFKVLYKCNGGVSSARNVGLNHASGEWIAFIDADDYVDEYFLSGLDAFSECDVLQKCSVTITEEEKIVTKRKVELNNILFSPSSIYKFFVNNRTNALWDKLIKRSLIGQNRFNESISIGEDFMFFLCLLPFVQRYAFSNIGQYYYVVRVNSAMASINRCKENRLKVIEENIHHIEKVLIEKKYEELKLGIIYATYIPILLDQWTKLTQVQRKLCVNYMKKIKFEHLRLLNWRKRKHLFLLVFKYYSILRKR